MINFEDVKKARDRISPYIARTPLLRVPALDEILNCQVYLKPENLQYTGSFKLRGATNKIESLSDEEKKRGVIAASSGNHAQGVASAAKRSNIPAIIVMPTNVNPVKLQACKDYGAEVILYGTKSSERAEKVEELVKKNGRVNIHPYADDFVKAGQGTISLEILEDEEDMDIIVSPIGGGGLISGLALGAKGIKKNIEIVGVEPLGAMRYAESLKVNNPIELENVDTIADGTRTDKADPGNFEIIREYVDYLVYAEDEEIKEAMKLLVEKAKIVAEPSSVMGIAAAKTNRIRVDKSTKVCFVLSGGNNDLSQLAEFIK